MKKKVALTLLCGIVLIGVCGCGKEEEKKEEIYGTYYNEFQGHKGEITLYKNGSCELHYTKLQFGKEVYQSVDKEYCTYDSTDDKLAISYNSYSLPDIYIDISCTIDGKKISCTGEGDFEKK